MAVQQKQKRELRFFTLHNFYGLYKSGALSQDDEENLRLTKQNVQHSNCIVYQSELPKFAEKYPAADMEDFTKFLVDTGALKGKGKKPAGERASTTRLNSPEAAIERGVSEENVGRYIELVEVIYATCRELNQMIPNARCSFAIPMKKVSTEEATPQA